VIHKARADKDEQEYQAYVADHKTQKKTSTSKITLGSKPPTNDKEADEGWG